MIETIISGIIVGICISAPMGPIGILCIQRTLNKGSASGFITGLGASFSDMLYATLVAFFMGFIVSFIETNETYIQIIGAILIFLFGIHIFRSKPKNNIYHNDIETQANSKIGLYFKDFATGFALCLSNPLIIFLFIALFARFNFFNPNDSLIIHAVSLTAMFSGALIWWTTLALIIGLVRNKFNNKTIYRINQGIGSILIIISVVGLIISLV